MNKRACSLLSLVLLTSISFIHSGEAECFEDRETLFVLTDFAPFTNLGYTPFELTDQEASNGTLFVKGFDVQVAAQIAHRLGFKEVKFQQVIFQDLLAEVGDPSLTNIGIAAISITKGRKDDATLDVEFIKYNDDSMAIFVPKQLFDDEAEIRDAKTVLSKLNELAGPPTNNTNLQKIAITSGSRQGAIIDGTSNPPYGNLRFSGFESIEDTIGPLKEETDLNVLFTDEPTAREIEKQNLLPEFSLVPGVAFDEAALPDEVSDGLGIAIHTQCCQLYVDVAQAIKDMQRDGTLARLREQFNTGTFTPLTEDLTPEDCTEQPNIDSNDISNFLFTKFCIRPVEAILEP